LRGGGGRRVVDFMIVLGRGLSGESS
jgi:hypothetical protein